MKRDADAKLKIVEYYHQCGSKTKTSAAFNISRQTLDNWIERHERDGLAGLVDKSRAHQSHPQTTPAPTIRHIVVLALTHPLLGGAALAKMISPPHLQVSAQTVNAVLRSQKLTTLNDRWQALELAHFAFPFMAVFRGGAPHLQLMLDCNPRYWDWDFIGSKPGEAIAFGVLPIQDASKRERVVMACAVDSASSFASVVLYPNREQVDPVAVIKRTVDFFSSRNLPTSRIAIHTSSLDSAIQQKRLQDYLAALKIGQRSKYEDDWGTGGLADHYHSIRERRCGSIEHFDRSVRAEFFDLQDRRRNRTLEDLQARLDDWLVAYNNGAELRGYPTMGKSPLQMIGAAQATAAATVSQGDDRD